MLDFHNHYVPPRLARAVVQAAPPAERARWETIARKLSDEELLLRDIHAGEISARVVNIPGALIAGDGGCLPHEALVGLNDDLAELVARHPGRIHGLASVDAYDGDTSAREAERAIRDLGMRGLFVDCARGEQMIDAPAARPTLEVAARLGVPVFVHPVAPQPLTRQMAPHGPVGMLFARGSANAASLIALVEGGVFSQLPNLRIVVTALAFGGIAVAAGLSPQSLDVMRKHVFIDTNIVQPALLRAAVDLLGPANVLAGSDWPINNMRLAVVLKEAMQRAGLDVDEQKAIAAGNGLRLLGIT